MVDSDSWLLTASRDEDRPRDCMRVFILGTLRRCGMFWGLLPYADGFLMAFDGNLTVALMEIRGIECGQRDNPPDAKDKSKRGAQNEQNRTVYG